jgi:DNA polymerase-3 subunit delta'
MNFPKVLGQERAAVVLEGLLKNAHIPSAMLFSGTEGVGYALMAREFAKALLCKSPSQAPCLACPDCLSIERGMHPDVKAVNALYQAALNEEDPKRHKTLRVETIRHLRQDMELESMLGGWKVAILEEAHCLETEAANALLKILEEPPRRTLWILVSSQPEKLPRTVLSRCFRIPLTPLSTETVRALLLERGVEPGKAAELSRLCEGSLGRALELYSNPGIPLKPAEGLLAPLEAADSLPRELYLARAQTELALFCLSQNLRLKALNGYLSFARAEGPLSEIRRLRRYLAANADPRTVLLLAYLEAQKA